MKNTIFFHCFFWNLKIKRKYLNKTKKKRIGKIKKYIYFLSKYLQLFFLESYDLYNSRHSEDRKDLKVVLNSGAYVSYPDLEGNFYL